MTRQMTNTLGRRRWAGVTLAVALGAGVVALDLLEGPYPQCVGLLVTVPLIAAVVTDVAGTAVAAAAGLLLAVLAGALQEEPGLTRTVAFTAPQVLRELSVAAAGILAIAPARTRLHREAERHSLRQIAEVAQQAILRPLPEHVDGLRLAVRSHSAASLATVGGDFYEVLSTPFEVRALVGDVRGHGLGAVRLASWVLGSFREDAHLVL